MLGGNFLRLIVRAGTDGPIARVVLLPYPSRTMRRSPNIVIPGSPIALLRKSFRFVVSSGVIGGAGTAIVLALRCAAQLQRAPRHAEPLRRALQAAVLVDGDTHRRYQRRPG